MMPPGMPPRHAGGRAYAKGGAVKPGAGWTESERTKTQVQHAPGKNDTKDLGRGKPITYATGGAIEHPVHGGMSPKMPSGSGGGEARLAKAKRARKNYKAA